jgi:hypothetical protein
MEQHELSQKVDQFLGDVDRIEPVSYDLGTPALLETEALHLLVGLGPAVVPVLLERLPREESAKRSAYLVLALNKLHDQRALAPLRELRARCQLRAGKNEWDYALIGQCNLAIADLEKGI